MCAHLHVCVCVYTCGGFLYIGVWLKMPLHKSSNPFFLFFQEAFSLNQVATFLTVPQTFPLGMGPSSEEPDLKPSSRCFLGFRPEDEKHFTS